MGDNDAGLAMWDPATGGGYDGLRADGPNLNQGAESTLVADLDFAARPQSGGGRPVSFQGRTDGMVTREALRAGIPMPDGWSPWRSSQAKRCPAGTRVPISVTERILAMDEAGRHGHTRRGEAAVRP